MSKWGDCPRCGNEITRFPATSRVDGTTRICDDCGTREAMADFEGQDLPPVNQPVVSSATAEPVVQAVHDANQEHDA